MSSVSISGAISVGEACATGCDGAGDATEQLGLGPCGGRSAPAHTGFARRTIVVLPPSWLALGEVGATATVKQGDFLYLRTNAPISIRLTVDDGAGGTRTYVEDVESLVLKTFPTGKPLELLEVQGSATIVFLVSGQS